MNKSRCRLRHNHNSFHQHDGITQRAGRSTFLRYQNIKIFKSDQDFMRLLYFRIWILDTVRELIIHHLFSVSHRRGSRSLLMSDGRCSMPPPAREVSRIWGHETTRSHAKANQNPKPNSANSETSSYSEHPKHQPRAIQQPI